MRWIGCSRATTLLATLVSMLSFGASVRAAADIRLATTTSTENSGLLKVILPVFEAKYGGKVRVVSVGTGAALKLGENGDADVPAGARARAGGQVHGGGFRVGAQGCHV